MEIQSAMGLLGEAEGESADMGSESSADNIETKEDEKSLSPEGGKKKDDNDLLLERVSIFPKLFDGSKGFAAWFPTLQQDEKLVVVNMKLCAELMVRNGYTQSQALTDLLLLLQEIKIDHRQGLTFELFEKFLRKCTPFRPYAMKKGNSLRGDNAQYFVLCTWTSFSEVLSEIPDTSHTPVFRERTRRMVDEKWGTPYDMERYGQGCKEFFDMDGEFHVVNGVVDKGTPISKKKKHVGGTTVGSPRSSKKPKIAVE
ncbi:unknown [Feldmannia species virus]|uniref:Uncharacterized protein n=1 Tax=Feldmannia species virus TaxID=39420 RepID=B5LWA4_9PHYC|nr:hypothetical protein FeldSpV_gp015 [Feldmannia species virus]ACH46767.1 unknown [Feldmannia species virus]